jgi:ABC-2 type transport system permease protein
MSSRAAAPPPAWPERTRADRPLPTRAATVLSRAWAKCLIELQKMRRDRTELAVRAVQPALWLIVFGLTFTRLRAIPTGNVPHLDFLTAGVIAQSGLFISIFYGIQIIWDRDAGVLAKLLATPTPRAALVAGKAFAAGCARSARWWWCSCSPRCSGWR